MDPLGGEPGVGGAEVVVEDGPVGRGGHGSEQYGGVETYGPRPPDICLLSLRERSPHPAR
jgi:hypothetical protein